MSEIQWYVCERESRGQKGFCLYTDVSVEKLESKKGIARCVKHGAILEHDPSLSGLSRQVARKKIEDDERAARNLPE